MLGKMSASVKKVYLPMHQQGIPTAETVMCDVCGIHSVTMPSATARGNRARSSILRKLAGYRQQDIAKDRQTADNATFKEVVSKLVRAQGQCTYCNVPLVICGGEKRNKLQWSLDRIDNRLGHSDANTVISCLACNLRRRARPHTKFLAGAKMQFVKTC